MAPRSQRRPGGHLAQGWQDKQVMGTRAVVMAVVALAGKRVVAAAGVRVAEVVVLVQ